MKQNGQKVTVKEVISLRNGRVRVVFKGAKTVETKKKDVTKLEPGMEVIIGKNGRIIIPS